MLRAARTGEATDGSTPTGLTARHWKGTGRVTGENESRIPHNPRNPNEVTLLGVCVCVCVCVYVPWRGLDYSPSIHECHLGVGIFFFATGQHKK